MAKIDRETKEELSKKDQEWTKKVEELRGQLQNRDDEVQYMYVKIVWS